ncbi:uncharacterized protein ISCGN_019293 [Ixodes scapularis]
MMTEPHSASSRKTCHILIYTPSMDETIEPGLPLQYEKMYVVFESCLLELFTICRTCLMKCEPSLNFEGYPEVGLQLLQLVLQACWHNLWPRYQNEELKALFE